MKDPSKAMDDDSSVISTSTNSQSRASKYNESSRDEEEEIRLQSQHETNRVLLWKGLVFLALLATAFSVTATTYSLLVRQEDENFRNVFAQFARTVSDAAINQQKSLAEALKTLTDTVSLTAELVGDGTPPWPFFVPPKWEIYAKEFKITSKAEFTGMNNLVRDDQRRPFVEYMNYMYQDFVKENHMIAHGHLHFLDNDTSKYNPFIAQKTSEGFEEDDQRDDYFVRTVQSPPPRAYGPQINWNVASTSSIQASMKALYALPNETTLSEIRPFLGLPDVEHQGFHSDDNADNPHCFAFHPVFRSPGNTSSEIVAMVTAAVAFDASLRNLLPSNVKGMLVVVSNTCNQTITYVIDGSEALFQGMADLHQQHYEQMAVEVDLNVISHPDFKTTPNHCLYSMTIYPTKDFENDYKTNTPAIFAAIVAGTFVMVALVFIGYDYMVKNRNEIMIANAAKSNAIVSSVVPEHLKARFLSEQERTKLARRRRANGSSLKTFLNAPGAGEAEADESLVASAPLADLFLDVTVLHADISGFTAWSSVREPTQVFVLLETIYQAFDRIAKKRRIMKVETVGDCYVAVCGIPDPRKEHAVAMARFAKDIVTKMQTLTKSLETSLGPDTGDLSLRVGMHSGPVTAGVLRGEMPRFQLFGDTMNMCARLEGSSRPNLVQCSKTTATLLTQFGKEKWLRKRTDTVTLKGFATQETWWVDSTEFKSNLEDILGDNSGRECLTSESLVLASDFPNLDGRTKRLIDWNVQQLSRLLREIESRRIAKGSRRSTSKRVSYDSLKTGATPLEEVREIITLPDFDSNAASGVDPESIELPMEVTEDLRSLVATIASMYNENPFHNFDHASHVVMSVIKHLSRIVAPSDLENLGGSSKNVASKLHDNTYGITSDPLTQFACAFSALIHDVDHEGVSNAQLVKEGLPIAAKYHDRSVAEQNSLDLSWELLFEPRFSSLRDFLFTTQDELSRFRQLVVNSVMSTDIVDKDLKALRNDRWDKAFKKSECHRALDENQSDDVNRKATIVIEHIIQASDISHTMQHWHVYRKWNQCLFEELYVAYLNGRAEKDPAEFWYKGEFGFFDFYIIPLTRKLKECGVFGVSSDENLNYALKNREEWEARGEEVVREMVEECRKKYGVKGATKIDLQEQAPVNVFTEVLV